MSIHFWGFTGSYVVLDDIFSCVSFVDTRDVTCADYGIRQRPASDGISHFSFDSHMTLSKEL